MASTPKWFDRVMASSTTTGTGTYTLGSAITGYQAWSVVGDGNSAYYCAMEVDGSGNPSGGWEVGLGTYTSSGTTLSRDTILASTNANAAVSWAAGTRRIFLVTPGDVQTHDGLEQLTSSADADFSLQVGACHSVDISGYTADRTATLPATAKVGDRCAIELSAGDTAFELLVTAASGDTLVGVRGSIAGGTEYTRLFITGERMVFKCVEANAKWLVVEDGRLAQFALVSVSTQGDGETANTVTLPSDSGGAHTAVHDNANLVTTSNGRITLRRDGHYTINVNGQSKDTVTDGNSWGAVILVNGTELVRGYAGASGNQANMRGAAFRQRECIAGDYVQLAYLSSIGGMGIRALTAIHLTVIENLKVAAS